MKRSNSIPLSVGRPELVLDWHPDRNGDLTPSDVTVWSKELRWWACRCCGHEWQARPYNRSAGTGCPVCRLIERGVSRGTPPAGGSLADLHPDISAQLHPHENGPLTARMLYPRSNKKVIWLCGACAYVWTAAPSDRVRGRGCFECAKPMTGQSFLDMHPELMDEWDYARNEGTRPQDLTPRSDRHVWWICRDCGRRWEASLLNRTAPDKPRGCSDCGYRRVSVSRRTPQPGRSLAELEPRIAAEWHPDKNGDLTPVAVSSRSNQRAWWICAEGSHVWSSVISSRTIRDGGCPHCCTVGTSVVESTLRVGVGAHYSVAGDRFRVRPMGGARPIWPDILLTDHAVIIEFDGAYWHNSTKAHAKDELRIRQYEALGYSVIRVREAPLVPIGRWDICVPVQTRKDPENLLDAVLERVRDVLGARANVA